MGELSGKKILIMGATGMLASDLIPVLKREGAELVLSSDHTQNSYMVIDITHPDTISNCVHEAAPDWIVNCAAYTKVDDAERERDIAFAVNSIGAANLAKVAKANNVRLVHISTDYVFGGMGSDPERREPYKEEESPCPCGIYGHSKHFGDELIRAILPDDHLIIRTSWLHGAHGKNFVDTMLRLGEKHGEVGVVNDQIGSPTWTGWLAEVIASLIIRNERGVFHATSRGGISWYEFAKEIFKQAKLEVILSSQNSEEVKRPAPRPAYSVLDVSKLEKCLAQECIDWKECVSKHLASRV